MAVIHHTTLVPSKLELLAAWLPSQPWYRGTAEPELSRAGGFRLDDPAGDVGIEVMVVNEVSGTEPMSYLTPLTYRSASLSGAEAHLIGTTEHGVLGQRWVYDGLHDRVFVEQMLALLRGGVEAQAQDESNTVDSTVSRSLSDTGEFRTSDRAETVSGARSTDVQGLTLSSLPVTLRVLRALNATSEASELAESIGQIDANWAWIDGETRRGAIALLAQA
jgi:Maltokinase N-terminal cap domain